MAFAAQPFDGLESIGSVVFVHMAGDTAAETQELAESPQESVETATTPSDPPRLSAPPPSLQL